MIRIAIAGIAGRMGQIVARLVHEDPELELVGGIIGPGSDPEQILLRVRGAFPGWSGKIVNAPEHLLPDVDVLVDFTNPETTLILAGACLEHGVALVSGTTGLDADQMQQLGHIARDIPAFHSANTSLGITAILEVLPRLARALSHYDVEIVESHHRYKADAPSGTAYSLVRALSQSTAPNGERSLVFGRHGAGKRVEGEIGVHAVRAGGNHGEHSVILASEDEQVTLSHRSFSRLAYARGAVRAIAFIVEQPAGLYTTSDLFR